jgi:hypothetical protein
LWFHIPVQATHNDLRNTHFALRLQIAPTI